MATKPQNGNLRMVILIGGFMLTIATIVFAAGGVWPAIETNKSDIASHHEDGCKPSVLVRQDVAKLQVEVESLKEMRSDITDIKNILMKQVR